jgi:hypothetical protein
LSTPPGFLIQFFRRKIEHSPARFKHPAKIAYFRGYKLILCYSRWQSQIIMGDSNPKNKQKQQAQQSAKKAGNQKKPATPSSPAKKK